MRALLFVTTLLMSCLASAMPWGYSDPDSIEIEHSVLIYQCTPTGFHLWLAPDDTALGENDAMIPFNVAERASCTSGGQLYQFSAKTLDRSETGFCAGAVTGLVSLYRNQQPIYENELLADYCRLSGLTEFHVSQKTVACQVERLESGEPVNACHELSESMDRLQQLGIGAGTTYAQARHVLLSLGWALIQPSPEEGSPLVEHPEVSCGAGRDGICSAGFKRQGDHLALMLQVRDGQLVVVGEY